MNKTQNIIIIFFFILITNCGYTPMLATNEENFYIKNLILEGDRNINISISNKLKKFKIPKKNSKEYNLNINSFYNKEIGNKDDKGNPKNYNLKLKTEILVQTKDGKEFSKSFNKSISLSVEDSKNKERENEKKFKKSLSNIVAKEILFYISNI